MSSAASRGAGDGAGGAGAFASFYDATIGRAYGLALRITGSEDLAAQACDAAYPAAWKASQPAETDLFGLVRAEALARKPAAPRSDAPTSSYSLRGELERRLAELDLVARRSLELAYFGGLDVTAIGELLGAEATEVRRALRRGLLHVGSAIAAPEPMP